MKFIYALITLTTLNTFANSPSGDIIENLNWNGIDVVFLEDNSFPKYLMSVEFQDGALSDSPSVFGETEVMFDQLTSGTDSYSQEQIADSLEFFGSNFSTSVQHENSSIAVSGLAKDVTPTLKMVCHMFKRANFPEKELKKFKDQVTSGFKNLVTNHSALADRVFRKLSLAGTPFENHSGGYLKTIQRISPKNLHDKLKYFNENVRKKIYITGPRKILNEMSKIIDLDCQWKGDKNQVVRVDLIDQDKLMAKKPQTKAKIYLIPVPKANQAQIRIGRFLNPSYTKGDFELLELSSALLGDGFTSKLMQTLRVKLGLTYGVYSYAGTQKTYGRAGISTSTKNETVFKIIDETKRVLEESYSPEGISILQIENVKNFLSGSYLFKFQTSSAYLGNIKYFNHIGRNIHEMFEFPDKIKNLTTEQVAAKIKNVFNFNQQVIVVVGDKLLKSQLAQIGDVEVLDHTNFY